MTCEEKQLWEILPFVTWSKIYFPMAKKIHSDCYLFGCSPDIQSHLSDDSCDTVICICAVDFLASQVTIKTTILNSSIAQVWEN